MMIGPGEGETNNLRGRRRRWLENRGERSTSSGRDAGGVRRWPAAAITDREGGKDSKRKNRQRIATQCENSFSVLPALLSEIQMQGVCVGRQSETSDGY